MDLRERVKAVVDDLLARVPVEIVSKLDRVEAMRRLQDAIDSDWTFWGSKPVVGKVDAYGFRLRWRIGYRNSFQTHMSGVLKDEGRRTRVVARTGTHPFAAVFMAVWLSIVAFATATVVMGSLQAASTETAPAIVFLVPPMMLVFGLALIGIGRWVARNERERLIAFLETTLDAKRAP